MASRAIRVEGRDLAASANLSANLSESVVSGLPLYRILNDLDIQFEFTHIRLGGM